MILVVLAAHVIHADYRLIPLYLPESEEKLATNRSIYVAGRNACVRTVYIFSGGLNF